jgi:hypothetical protein
MTWLLYIVAGLKKMIGYFSSILFIEQASSRLIDFGGDPMRKKRFTCAPFYLVPEGKVQILVKDKAAGIF